MSDSLKSVAPTGERCEGCGCQIPDDDEPNLIIGKDPVQFCSRCVEFASLVSQDGAKWKVSPVKCEMDDKVIAGALFDFLGWLTSRETVLKLGSSEHAPPAVDALEKWAALRGLLLEEAEVKTWNGERMGFSGALMALKSGKIVRNANWNGKGENATAIDSEGLVYL